MVLRLPEGVLSRGGLRLKRFLFGRVDLFVHYFRDLTWYGKYFHIASDRSVFIPFKANIFERHSAAPDPSGEYILCLGRSLRDYDTFFEAVKDLPYPAAITQPDFEGLRNHGARFTLPLSDLPKRVRVLDDDGSLDSEIAAIKGARVVVIAILAKRICASGIGIYLSSMLLGKCIVMTEGPGASDILSDQAILVPPEDADALRNAIRAAWEDEGRRQLLSKSAYEYAHSLGGEKQLIQRVLDAVIPRLA